MNIQRIHHVAVIASDYPRSLAFYTQVLGMEVSSENYRPETESYKTDLSLNGQYTIELFSLPYPAKASYSPEPAGFRHLAFGVADIAAAAHELDEKGIARQEIRTDRYTGKRFFYFADPDGMPLELYEL